MAKSNNKINIAAVITTISFLYLAFIPYITNVFYNLILGIDFTYVIRNLFSAIFNFGNAVHFVGCLLIAIGILTKFDKIALAASSSMFWLSILISLISNIINSTKYNYRLEVRYYLSTAFSLLIYFLFIAVGVLFTIFFFMKKPIPKLLKITVFVPVALLAISLIITFFSNTSNVISAFTGGFNIEWVIYLLISNSVSTFNAFVNLIGFTVASFKIAEISFKKKTKNTVEISGDIVIENVNAE